MVELYEEKPSVPANLSVPTNNPPMMNSHRRSALVSSSVAGHTDSTVIEK